VAIDTLHLHTVSHCLSSWHRNSPLRIKRFILLVNPSRLTKISAADPDREEMITNLWEIKSLQNI